MINKKICVFLFPSHVFEASRRMAKTSKIYQGGCLCGDIRFEVKGPPQKPHTCSCEMCQRHSGALTLCWVEFPKDKISWTGSGGVPSVFRSSSGTSRMFCPICGSSIGAMDDAPTIALLLGSFDKKNAKQLRPANHSYRSGRPKWWSVDVGT